MYNTADIYLDITSPDTSLIGMMVGKVSLPGRAGRFTVLPGHAPMISSLSEGDIEYTAGRNTRTLHVKSGFVEVSENKVSVCVEI